MLTIAAIADSVPRIKAAGVSIDCNTRDSTSNGLKVWSPSASATGDSYDLGFWYQDDEE